MDRIKVKAYIEALLERHRIVKFPVDLGKWVEIAGAELLYDNFEDKLSGFSYQKNGIKKIGINSSHNKKRKRFTIAHELGHMFLHKQNAVNYDTASILLRLGHSTDVADPKEIEANIFAAELLMPEENIRKDMASLGQISLEDKKIITKLADKYEVSDQAMTIRLANLYFN